MNSSPTPWWQNEDWLALGIGLLTIAAVLGAHLTGTSFALPACSWQNGADLVTKVLAPSNLIRALLWGLAALFVSAAGLRLMGCDIGKYARGFAIVYVLALAAQVLAGNKSVNELGLEYVIFALLIGLTISHSFSLPEWLREAARTEYFIKTGLVILGAGILFQEIRQAGLLGILQAVGVVSIVWYFCFWLARRLGVDDEFGTMLATAVSICGVSAAIAACGAIQGDRRKLSYVTSLVLLVALPMMIAMPWLVKTFNIPELVAGAWLGGTLDTSGSVVAAGALISEAAMKTGVIVKLSQNVLIGVAAFALSIWWTLRSRSPAATDTRPSVAVIWERFPKFVLGFLLASLIFSFLLDPELVKETKRTLSGLRTMWFALAFVAIGLETRLLDIFRLNQGRPALAFVGAQFFNIIWTLILAWLIFGGVLFDKPSITSST